MNAWVDVARAEIVEKYQPGEHDQTTYLLQAAHIDEGDYFSSRVHKDIDAIIEDMRQTHRGRSDSAPKKSVIEEMKQDLEEVASFKGSRLEQWLLIYCKQNHLPYNRLTEEEKQWLIRIGSKSDFIHVIDFSRHSIYTNESNTHVPVWNHKILLNALPDGTTEYSDEVEIGVGWKTIFVWLWAKCFYSYRQKRWMYLFVKK